MNAASTLKSIRIGIAAVMLCSCAISAASAQGITDRMKSWFTGSSKSDDPAPDGGAPQKEATCPGVEVRNGAATLSISQPGTEAGPMTTRYQVTIGDTARECRPSGPVMSMKVGIEGRVLLGPAGSPGQVDIPLRIAVVQEGVNPKTIMSKFYRVPVSVPPGQTSVGYAQVEQDLSFPMPPPAVLDAYVVYVGFDPNGLPSKPERKPAKAKPKKKQ